jgi:hypothetical protein
MPNRPIDTRMLYVDDDSSEFWALRPRVTREVGTVESLIDAVDDLAVYAFMQGRESERDDPAKQERASKGFARSYGEFLRLLGAEPES